MKTSSKIVAYIALLSCLSVTMASGYGAPSAPAVDQGYNAAPDQGYNAALDQGYNYAPTYGGENGGNASGKKTKKGSKKGSKQGSKQGSKNSKKGSKSKKSKKSGYYPAPDPYSSPVPDQGYSDTAPVDQGYSDTAPVDQGYSDTAPVDQPADGQLYRRNLPAPDKTYDTYPAAQTTKLNSGDKIASSFAAGLAYYMLFL